jgi:hypothetical protein
VAVAFDAVGPGSVGASITGSTTLSWTHTGVGSALAYVAGGGCAADAATTTLTVGGTSATSLGKVHNGGGTAGFTEMFGVANIGSGGQTVVWTSSISTDLEAGSTSFTGAGTTFGTAFANQATHASSGNATSDSVTITGTTAGNRVSGVGSSGFDASSFTASQRWLKNLNQLSAAGNAAGGDTAAGGSVVLTLTIGSSDFIGVAGVEVVAGGAAEASFPHRSLRRAGQRTRFRRYQPTRRQGFETEPLALAVQDGPHYQTTQYGGFF